MPRLPRISSREAIRVLERLGFEQVRQTGSHVVMKKETLMVWLDVLCLCIKS